MMKEFTCDKTAACRTWEKRFATYGDYTEAYSLGMVRCPVCGNDSPTPTVSQTARPQFKGSGFYENDYRK